MSGILRARKMILTAPATVATHRANVTGRWGALGAPPLDSKTVGAVAAFLHAKHPEAAAKFVAALPPDLARAAERR